ncbi:MAG TPA: 3-dehydro-L-gulonate 2-dehydrogenase [Cyclobacteriaceae bacterium]|nr:3-dehydro-L-gulonate 2-dehydrogenase [Cyclobacteriaceae bacterium]
MPDFIRIPPSTLLHEFHRILIANGFDNQKALACAEIFANNSIDGIYSHGVNRFARFVGMVKAGTVKPSMEPVLKSKNGNVEQWNGQLGPGPLNALKATDRVIELAKSGGIGCVAMSHTNHWMRGGTYGWRAAKAGCVFIGWSNTIANTPAWGAINHKLGNNPLVLAVPHGDEAIVLDMAMSQFSYGAMEMYELKNEKLPVYGGFDTKGNLTTDPSEIKKTQRTLPIGYWKGAGLSLLLDILGVVLSDGLSVAGITAQDSERNLSQVFIGIDVSKFGNTNLIQAILDDFKTSVPETPGKTVRYPGENVVETRAKNLAEGIPVSQKVWDEIRYL